MRVKWWLNWRKPRVTYSTTTFQSMATGQPTQRINSQYTPSTSSMGGTIASPQATQP